jgi:hypothetical protein
MQNRAVARVLGTGLSRIAWGERVHFDMIANTNDK